MTSHHFLIADHHVCINFRESKRNSIELIPSFKPFETFVTSSGDDDNANDNKKVNVNVNVDVPVKRKEAEMLFEMTIDDDITTFNKSERQRIRTFETGNGDTIVDKMPDGSYQYIIRNIAGSDCCLLKTNSTFTKFECALNGNYNMRSFGLNNALMLAYAFASSSKQTLLIHASLVRHGDYGYPFIAKSGTGKSTHVSMWLRYIPHCDLMNDDNPIIRIIDDTPYIYGSPWSGKTPCYRNTKARLGAVSRIERDTYNHVERLKGIDAFVSFLPSCSTMKWDNTLFDNLCKTVAKIAETTPIYTVHCLPDEEAARLSFATITQFAPENSPKK